MKPIAAVLTLCCLAAQPLRAASPADRSEGAADDIGYATVEAALAGLRSDPNAKFSTQEGWTVVASQEHGRAVQWFFTPQDHPAYPSVVKRTVGENRGVGVIDMAALCEVEQSECDRLIEDFRQISEPALRKPPPERVTLEVGVTINNHERVRIYRLAAEAGKAAEIRLDDQLKVVIVPTLDSGGDVMYWIAMYEYDGGNYVLLARPELTMPGSGNAALRVASRSGNTFGFSITRLANAPEASG
ncbi:MAG TPA: hypothetical protein VFV10_10685 [Gammaproteobacteria bacterium]|nr:hypothetical protein [Gammaproteobacteria bacterium]